MWKYVKKVFFHLIYGYSKHQSNLHKDDVNNFSMLDWDILSMSAISHVVQCLLFSINVLIWLLPTSIGLPDCGTSSREKLHKLQTSVWNFTNQFWQIQSVTALFPHKSFSVFQLHNEIVSFEDTWMDPETVREWSKSKRKKQILYNMVYMWKSEKW